MDALGDLAAICLTCDAASRAASANSWWSMLRRRCLSRRRPASAYSREPGGESLDLGEPLVSEALMGLLGEIGLVLVTVAAAAAEAEAEACCWKLTPRLWGAEAGGGQSEALKAGACIESLLPAVPVPALLGALGRAEATGVPVALSVMLDTQYRLGVPGLGLCSESDTSTSYSLKASLRLLEIICASLGIALAGRPALLA